MPLPPQAETGKIESGKIQKWVTFYSWITIAAVIYGILAAHVPFIIGHPWSSCKVAGSDCACVLVFHLYEVPLTLFNTYVGWYGLKRFSSVTLPRFRSLVGFAVTANLVFFTFETGLLLDGLRRQAPTWENVLLTSVALILVVGAGLGIYLKNLLTEPGQST